MDDEWHAIAKAATATPRDIVLSFGLADHSIPVALYYHALIGAGLLSEAWMFAVPLAAGIAMAVLLVAAMRKVLPPLALGLYAGLLAISPLLVLYARQARPYALSVALALAAAWAAYRWWQSGKSRYVAAHLLCAPLAIWLHMIVAPFVLGAWVVLFLEWIASPGRDLRRFAGMVAVGGLAVVLTAALIGPPFLHDLDNIRAKAAQDFPTLHTAVRTAALFAGTASALPAALMAFLAAFGVAVLARRAPQATRFAAALVLLQVATVLASHAYLLHYPIVLARYLLVCLPLAFLAVAAGAAAVLEPIGRRLPAGPWVAAAVALAALAALGPLPRALEYPNSFVGNHLYFFEFDERENAVAAALRPGPIPDFYRQLAAQPRGSLTLLEAPWRYESIFNRLPVFQEVHRQKVKVGMVGGVCPPGGRAEEPRRFANGFENVVDLAKPADVLRREADYLVLHRVLELPNLSGPWLLPGGRALPDVAPCMERFRASFGQPVFEDATVTVFALGRR